MKRPAKKFALGTLAVSIIWILFEHVLGYNSTRHDIGQYTRLVPMIFFWIMIVVAIYHRRKGQGHTLRFSEGFQTGALMTGIYCTGITIVIILYQQFLNPDYYNTLSAFTQSQLAAKGATPEEAAKAMKQLEMSASGSLVSYLLLFVFSSVWGLLITLIASWLLKKQPPS